MAFSDRITFYWVHQDVMPKDETEVQKTYMLAYQAVMKDKKNGKPTRLIQIRSDGHPTTRSQGVTKRDPYGNHWTISHKGDREIEQRVHFTIHAYTKDPHDFKLRKTRFGAKKRDTGIKENGKEYWPDESELHFGADIAVSELEEYSA